MEKGFFPVVSGGFSLGTALSWTSPALMKIDSSLCLNGDGGCDIPGVSHEEASWIGALFFLGAVLSGPFAGKNRETRLNQSG